MRCLTLADVLSAWGAQCTFICRRNVGNLLEEIANRGHRTVALSAPSMCAEPADGPPHWRWLETDWACDAEETYRALGAKSTDWLVIDHYALDYRWETILRKSSRCVMVLDDLADRRHDCDLILDPSFGRSAADYAGLLPADAIALFGPAHSLLRPDFAQLRSESLSRRITPKFRQLLISMGGIDKNNETGRVLGALDSCTLPSDLRITAVMGPHSPWLAEVKAQAAQMRTPTQIRVGVNDMARLMTDSDLAIGAGGGTSWERCCLGLPSIVLILAENQRQMSINLQNAGAIIAAANAEDAVKHLQIHSLAGTMPDFLGGLSAAAASITDGQGATRAARAMMQWYD
jgi:UDP-2,4-diacetamido-2,4,6-trideoxy-beta-L-altropyranose hydrolase